jgi:hypothetical protein
MSAKTSNPPLTTIDRSGGYATVRLNQTLYFNGSIWFQGQVSGSLAPGAVLRGRDNNPNGIPDLLERLFREGKIHSVSEDREVPETPSPFEGGSANRLFAARSFR